MIYAIAFILIGLVITGFLIFLYSIKLSKINNFVYKEMFLKTMSVFFKQILSISYLIFLIIIILIGLQRISLSQLDFVFPIMGILAILSSLILLFIPIFSSILYLEKNFTKDFLKKFFTNSFIFSFILLLLSCVLVTLFFFLNCFLIEHCQSEAGMFLIVAYLSSVGIFIVYSIVVAPFAYSILYLTNHYNKKKIFGVLFIILLVVSIFNYFTNRSEYYYLKESLKKNNILICDKYKGGFGEDSSQDGWKRNLCKQNFIIFNKLGADKCEQHIKDIDDRDKCIFYYALYNNDLNSCENIPSNQHNEKYKTYKSNYCKFILSIKDVNQCNIFPQKTEYSEDEKATDVYKTYNGSSPRIDLCFGNYALAKKDPNICRSIYAKDNCFEDLAFYLQDINLCQEISKGDFSTYYMSIINCKSKIIK